MTILLVEDDIELARSLLERFRENGYSVLHMCDGETGLKEARSKEYGVIVLDRMLPGMSGLDFVKALRREARMTPVIYLTTMGGIDDRVQGLEAGGDDYLVKPFAFEGLLARVRVAARQSARAAARLLGGSLEIDVLHWQAARAGRSRPR